MSLIKIGSIAGLSLILAAAVSGPAMAEQPADNVDQLRASLTRSQQRTKELEASEARLTEQVRALEDRLRATEARLRDLAKRGDASPRDDSALNPAITRRIGQLADQLRKHPVPPPVHRAGLFLLDTVTGQASRVVDEPDAGLTWCGSPSWSADGTQIIFDATPDQRFRATRMKAIGLTEEGPKVTDLGLGNCPSLAPGGGSLAIMDNPGGCVTVMRIDGSGRRRGGPYGRPTWSADGGRILISGLANPCPVWLVSADGEAERPVQVPGQELFLSPSWVDETTIVSVVGTDLASASIALLDVSEPSRARVKEVLWKRGTDIDVKPSCPVYSAATDRLVFVGTDERGVSGLYSLRRGLIGPPQRVAADVASKNMLDLAISPDGRYVLFSSDRP